MTAKLERALGGVSIVAGALHGLREGLAHAATGQFLPLLWIELVAAAMLVLTGLGALRGRASAAGLFGAWSLALATQWIGFFTLVQRVLENRVPQPVIDGLGAALLAWVTALLGFATSGWLAWRSRPR